jgi:cysteine desulfurase/selenocysteine lyase
LVSHSFPFEKDDVVLTTDREHNSNLAPWHFLEQTKGIKHEVVPSNIDNSFNIEKFKEILSKYNKKVKLVSMCHTGNLDGVTIPAKEIIEIAHDAGARVLLDAAQSAPHMPIDVQKLNVDFLAFSIHKMCGPSGMGILYGKYDLLEKMPPFIAGGDTVEKTTYESSKFLNPPSRFEGGLQDYAGIIGAGAAAKYLMSIGLEDIKSHEIQLNNYITNELLSYPEIMLIGPKDASKRGGIFSFNIKGLEPHDIAMILDESANIMIRSGMHCVHSWFFSRGIKGSARASLYLYNTLEEAKVFVENMREIITKFGLGK